MFAVHWAGVGKREKKKKQKKKAESDRKCNSEDTKQQNSTGDTKLSGNVLLLHVEFSRKLVHNGS